MKSEQRDHAPLTVVAPANDSCKCEEEKANRDDVFTNTSKKRCGQIQLQSYPNRFHQFSTRLW